jgi:hypothetical protein
MAGTSLDTYWILIFMPCILLLVAFALYLLFTLPEIHFLPASAVRRIIHEVSAKKAVWV